MKRKDTNKHIHTDTANAKHTHTNTVINEINQTGNDKRTHANTNDKIILAKKQLRVVGEHLMEQGVRH